MAAEIRLVIADDHPLLRKGLRQVIESDSRLKVLAKAGSAIPVGFSLSGDRGLGIFATGFPASQQTTCNTSDPAGSIEETVAAGASSLTYDPATDQYTYIWKTNTAWENACQQLAVKLKDGSTHVALFQFK